MLINASNAGRMKGVDVMYHTAFVSCPRELRPDLPPGWGAVIPVEITNAANGSEESHAGGTSIQHFWHRASGTPKGTSDAFHARLHVKAKCTSDTLADRHLVAGYKDFGYTYNNGYYESYTVTTLYGVLGIYRLVYRDDTHTLSFHGAIGQYVFNHDAHGLTVPDDNISWSGTSCTRTGFARDARFEVRVTHEAFMAGVFGNKFDDVYYRYLSLGLIDSMTTGPGSASLYCVPDVVWHDGEGEYEYAHNEFDAYLGFVELGLLPNLYRNGFACAATDAATHLPEVSSNGIANVLDVAKAIIDVAKMFKGDFSAITDLASPRNAWLAYRYSYKTTKADIAEYATLASRLDELAKADHVRVGGFHTHDGVNFKATIEFAIDDVIPSDVQGACKQFGLELSALNAWDLVPYSFVVDWFLDIGGKLERLELFDRLHAIQPVSAWYSVTTRYKTSAGLDQDVYFRLGSLSTRDLGAPWWDNYDPSRKTKIYRFIDGIALFG